MHILPHALFCSRPEWTARVWKAKETVMPAREYPFHYETNPHKHKTIQPIHAFHHLSLSFLERRGSFVICMLHQSKHQLRTHADFLSGLALVYVRKNLSRAQICYFLRPLQPGTLLATGWANTFIFCVTSKTGRHVKLHPKHTKRTCTHTRTHTLPNTNALPFLYTDCKTNASGPSLSVRKNS